VTLPGRLVLLGHPVGHSLSPRFQNAALDAAGIPLRYEALDVPPERLGAVLAELRQLGAAGNVTVPHKAAAHAACARHTMIAARTGAVNTFWHEDGALVGDNTDVAGFLALAGTVLGTIPAKADIALIGAGGAAAAVCAAIEDWPSVHVAVYSRTPGRSRDLAKRFPFVNVASTVEACLANATVVVNATPIGLTGEEMPVPVENLPRDAAVMDLAYRPGQTPWSRAALAAGHRAADGLEMLIAQGAEAFERWFGRAPDRDVMRRALGA
jgi:shikimate dehydrogenase